MKKNPFVVIYTCVFLTKFSVLSMTTPTIKKKVNTKDVMAE